MTVTALFGGTFDPIHFGHIKSALSVSHRLNAEVCFVPCRIPPHRPQPGATPAQRLAMLSLAVAEEPHLSVDDCELQREGTSFTIDTLRGYRQRLGESASLVFVLGVDAWLTLSTWKDWQSLTDVAHLLVLGRPGYEPVAKPELEAWASPRTTEDDGALVAEASGSIRHLVLEQVDVSATMIRERIGAAEPIDDLVPAVVNRYIADEHLYLPSATTH